jgi:adenosylcobinamide-phosphate synthase
VNHLPTRCRTLLVALACDTLMGELPNDLHPVVWIGRWLKLGERLAPSGDATRLGWGAAWLLSGAALAAGATALIPAHPLARGALASTLLAYRALDRAVGEVQAALDQGNLDEARRLLGWHLVSRPTAELRADEVAAAAIESLAENLSDSLVAPLLAYLVGDLPGLAAYRLINTADAMWGYRDQRYEYLGKTAARSDDLLNLAPARITAALLAIVAQLINGRGLLAWRVARRDHAHTASPNAGWPMAAMAGALATTLTKRDHYSLGNGAHVPNPTMMAEARTIARVALALIVGGLVVGGIRSRGGEGKKLQSPSEVKSWSFVTSRSRSGRSRWSTSTPVSS